MAESGNSASVSWLSLQFSFRDQGDLAELEFRLSIITILYEWTNMLNYTARNIFAYQEAKVVFCSSGKFQISMISCLLRRYWVRGNGKILPSLPCCRGLTLAGNYAPHSSSFAHFSHTVG